MKLLGGEILALIFKGARCSICNNILNSDDRIFATSGVFLPDVNPLHVYCDTAMHLNCYVNWDKRRDFAFEYVKFIIDCEQNNVSWAKVYLDNDFYISVSLCESIGLVRIIPIHTGEFVDVKLDSWSSWIEENKEIPNILNIDNKLNKILMKTLLSKLPTKESILKVVDWDNKQLQREKYISEWNKAQTRAEEERLELVTQYNKKIEKYYNSKLSCPKCKNKNIRFVNKNPEKEFYFICRECGRSFGLNDIIK
jgi:hypothetical protein